MFGNGGGFVGGSALVMLGEKKDLHEGDLAFQRRPIRRPPRRAAGGVWQGSRVSDVSVLGDLVAAQDGAEATVSDFRQVKRFRVDGSEGVDESCAPKLLKPS